MLIRVFEVPRPSGNFHFQGGEPQTFLEVDWFRDDMNPFDGTQEARERLTAFIQRKPYYRYGQAFLVLHPLHSFTINYEAP